MSLYYQSAIWVHEKSFNENVSICPWGAPAFFIKARPWHTAQQLRTLIILTNRLFISSKQVQRFSPLYKEPILGLFVIFVCQDATILWADCDDRLAPRAFHFNGYRYGWTSDESDMFHNNNKMSVLVCKWQRRWCQSQCSLPTGLFRFNVWIVFLHLSSVTVWLAVGWTAHSAGSTQNAPIRKCLSREEHTFKINGQLRVLVSCRTLNGRWFPLCKPVCSTEAVMSD